MKVAFIGCGNMGGAMISAIVTQGAVPAENVYIYDKDAEKTAALRESLGVSVCADEKEAASKAEVVFIAVKPVVVDSVLQKIAYVLQDRITVSVAAGVTVHQFLERLGDDVKLVRSIPNLPAFVGEGLSGLFFYNFTHAADLEKKEAVTALFASFGKTVTVEHEKMIDEMIAVTSSSPAYFCMMIDALADGAVRAGFTRKDALMMAEQAMLGTAKYLLEKEKHPGVLKDEVCSPAGTTIEAVAALEREGFRNSIIKAMEACAEKAVRKEGYV